MKFQSIASALILLLSTQVTAFAPTLRHSPSDASRVCSAGTAIIRTNRGTSIGTDNGTGTGTGTRLFGYTQNKKLYLDDGHRLAYDLYTCNSDDGVIFLPNLSDGRFSTASNNVEDWCERNNSNYICADWFGRGGSSGKLMEATVSRWTSDTIALMDEACPVSKAVFVGKGVGLWVAVLVALKRPDLVRGIVGLGGDPDFTEDLLWAGLPEETKAAIMENGFMEVEWGGKGKVYPITSSLIEDGRKNLVLRGGPKSLDITCPVRLLHSLEDEEVPPSTSLKLAEAIKSNNVVVFLNKYGMSTPYRALKQVMDFSREIKAQDFS